MQYEGFGHESVLIENDNHEQTLLLHKYYKTIMSKKCKPINIAKVLNIVIKYT